MALTGSGSGEPSPCLRTALDREESITVRVVEAVAAEADADVADLPPLESAVDTNAIERLVEASGTEWRLRFRYHGYEVVVDSDRSVALYDVQ